MANKGFGDQKGVSRGPGSPGRQQMKLGSPRGLSDKNKNPAMALPGQKLVKSSSGKDFKKDDKKGSREKGKKPSAKKEVKTTPIHYRLFKPAKVVEEGEEGAE